MNKQAINLITDKDSDDALWIKNQMSKLGLCDPIWDFPLELHLTGEILALCFVSQKQFLKFDWAHDFNKLLKQKVSIKQENLGRALYPQHRPGDEKSTWKVVDATCGTGKDTLFMLAMGLPVIAFEMNPLIYLLLAYEQKKLTKKFQVSLELMFGDFKEHSEKWRDVSAVYFDPMYDQLEQGEKITRKALPRKEMMLFHQLFTPYKSCKAEQDLKFIKDTFIGRKDVRIVVKRNLKAPEIHSGVNAKFRGKNTRFDLYLTS